MYSFTYGQRNIDQPTYLVQAISSIPTRNNRHDNEVTTTTHTQTQQHISATRAQTLSSRTRSFAALKK